jgi:hypothetical protein
MRLVGKWSAARLSSADSLVKRLRQSLECRHLNPCEIDTAAELARGV